MILGSKKRPATIVFDRRYSVAVPGVPLDPHRAENIATFLAAERLCKPDQFQPVGPASLRAIRLVHSDAYLEAVTQASTVERILGSAVADVDALLQHQRLHAGGTRVALRLALARKHAVFHLGGGMHHAGPAGGHGFCVFNDIAVAIHEARKHGFTGRIAVIDCDLHDGDGTRLCFAQDTSVHTWSVHNQTLDTTPAVEATLIPLGANVEDATYLAALDHLPARPDAVIFVAGADPAHDDPLGNWKISDAAMLERDRRVMAWAAGLPTVVVLGGGYGPQAWRYSARFVADYMRGKTIEPPHTTEMTLARLRHLRKTKDPIEEITFTEEELFGELHAAVPKRFLDYYSMHALEHVFERYGVFDRLRTLGYASPSLSWTLGGPTGDFLRIHGDAESLVGEVGLRRDRRTVPGFELLYVEWLLLQHPKGTTARPLMPGQKYPGLGMLAEAMGLFIMVCERLHLDGVAFVPMHRHLARIGARHMRFLHKQDAAQLDSTAPWRPVPMVLPLSDALRETLTHG